MDTVKKLVQEDGEVDAAFKTKISEAYLVLVENLPSMSKAEVAEVKAMVERWRTQLAEELARIDPEARNGRPTNGVKG